MDWEKRKNRAKDPFFSLGFFILYRLQGMKVVYKGGW